MATTKYPITGIVIVILLLGTAEGKCVNTTEFKYDFKDVTELVGYHSVCSEHAKRTCCSPGNFEFLSKKYHSNQLRMAKVIANNAGLSAPCRHKLTNALCSLCDGDIVPIY